MKKLLLKCLEAQSLKESMEINGGEWLSTKEERRARRKLLFLFSRAEMNGMAELAVGEKRRGV